MEQVRPYDSVRPKKEQVAEMFDNISPKYDFLNRILSFGIDQGWRRKLVRMAKNMKHDRILDIATGTGDLAIALSKIHPQHIDGMDISEGMLDVGRKKIRAKGLQDVISMEYGDSEEIPFPDATFDIITIGFGIRNFNNPLLGLTDIHRVLLPGGHVLILEFSKPTAFPIKQGYGFYSKYILPFWGKLISKDAAAYTYLPESVQAFPEGQDFLDLMKKAGFSDVSAKRLTFGIASIYKGKK